MSASIVIPRRRIPVSSRQCDFAGEERRVRTADSGEARVVPAANEVLLDEPLELALGEEGVDKVDASALAEKSEDAEEDGEKKNAPVVPDLDLPEVERREHPLVLRVSVPVLVRPKRVRNALEAVDDRARKVVGRVHLELVAASRVSSCFLASLTRSENAPGTVMRQRVSAVNYGIAHSLVGIAERNLGANAPATTLL